jgi:uncharacterized repeat protein (TIGR03809 family)
MTDEQALRRFNKTAEKWRDLAEKRRLYFEELHQSGRWKYYYTKTLFFQRLGEAAELVELWEPVLKARLTELPSAPKSEPKSPPVSSSMSPATSPPPSPTRASAMPRPRAI